MLGFIKQGLQDFSISRSHKRAHGWGVPVPGDPSQIMYVWFDALSNYITALDYANDGAPYKKFWEQPGQDREVVHVLGKGVIRFHAVYWIGMLLSAGLPLPTSELVHGYLTVNGQRIGKSLGNVIEPGDLTKTYGIDAVRYFLLGALSPFYDGDFSEERLREYFGAHLANGVGNLFSRVIGMVDKYCGAKIPSVAPDPFDTPALWKSYHEAMAGYDFAEVVAAVNRYVTACDGKISEAKPWAMFKAGQDVGPLMYQLLEALRQIGIALLPIVPTSATKMLQQLGVSTAAVVLPAAAAWGALETGRVLVKPEPLFPRLVAEKV